MMRASLFRLSPVLALVAVLVSLTAGILRPPLPLHRLNTGLLNRRQRMLGAMAALLCAVLAVLLLWPSGSAQAQSSDPPPEGAQIILGAYNMPVEGGGAADLVVALDEPAGPDGVTVNFTISGGTATQGTDYTMKLTAVEIAPGASAGANVITSIDDAADEGDETIILVAKVPSLSLTSNTLTLTISDNDGRSSDATLSGLALLDWDGRELPLSSAFDPQTAEYGGAVPLLSRGWVRLRPTANHAGASITVDGKRVASGSRSESFFLEEFNKPKRIVVAVTAEDGQTRREYAVTATWDPRAELRGLSVSPGRLHPFVFRGLHTEYRAWVGHGDAEVKVTPTNRYDKGTITVNGHTVASGQASPAIALAEGENVITVTITGPDNYTSRTYTLTITRATATASADATLAGLAIHTATSSQPDAGNEVPYEGAAYPLSPALASGVYDYRVVVPEAVARRARESEESGYVYVTAVATTTAPGAKSIVVEGRKNHEEARHPKRDVVTGEASGPWYAFIGYSPVSIKVTSLDGKNTQTYRVVVEHGKVDGLQGVALTPGDGQLTLSWGAATGSHPPNLYWARWREAGTTTWLNRATLADWKTGYGDGAPKATVADGQRVTGTSYVITGLTNGTEYEVELRGTRAGDTSYQVTNWLKSPWVTVKGTPGQTAAARTLTITPSAPSREYGGTDDLSYAVSGLDAEDAATDVVTGTLARAAGNDAGSYAFDLSGLSIATAYAQKYALPASPAVASYTITPRAITAISGVTVNSRPADGSVAATFDTSAANGTGVLAAELADFRSGGLAVSGSFPAATPGTHSLSVTYSLGDSGTFKAANYTLSAAADTLQGELTEAQACAVPAGGDHDADDDGLIEVSCLAQLSAIRWDPLGGGNATHIEEYVAAFPDAMPGLGCPSSGCNGYELITDLDFDTNGNGRADQGDAYWNDGAGWEPISSSWSWASFSRVMNTGIWSSDEFKAIFEGNGHTIHNLYMGESPYHKVQGLFSSISSGAVIRNLNLEAVNIHDSVYGAATGGLVGVNKGDIINSHVSGVISGSQNVGGLAGGSTSGASIVASSAAVRVTGEEGSHGGLVGHNRGFIYASYSSGDVAGKDNNVGGLVGYHSNSTIYASYAVGRVSNGSSSSDGVGGLIGKKAGGTVADSYWDTRTSGQSASDGGVGKTTAELQTPTGYGGIYAKWNMDLSYYSHPADPWDFGTSSQYPALKHAGPSAAGQRAQMPATAAPPLESNIDYDVDGDGLIEVSSRRQLNAIRWDLDGDGSSGDSGYATAFPNAASGMGCPSSGCIGYELASHIYFDANTSGQADAHDAYWNGGRGWNPIGRGAGAFAAVFEGNRYNVYNLYINSNDDEVGLFSQLAAGGEIRDLSLSLVDVTARGRVGSLVGRNAGTVSGAWVSGEIAGRNAVGGLVGESSGSIIRSDSAADVTGSHARSEGGRDVGGLVGRNGGSVLRSSHGALDTVSGKADNTGGLVGFNSGSIIASHNLWEVTGSGRYIGGLVGYHSSGTIRASYSASRTTGGTDVGGLVGYHGGTAIDSYWDSDQTQATGTGGEGKTTAELKTPTGYTGIYADWNVDLDGDGSPDDPWDFGTSSNYPRTWKRSSGSELGTQTPANQAPTVSAALGDVTGLEEGATQEVSLSGVFSDADSDTLTITAASDDEAIATVSVASDGSKLTVAGVGEGTATITVTAQDSDGNRVSDAFDAPVARKYNALIAQMYQWRNDPQWVSEKAHTDRWDRALLAFGETVADTTLTPMTADEAQEFADRGWERWVEVAAALREIEAAGQQQQQQGTPNRAPTVASALSDATIVNESGARTVSLTGVFSDADSDALTVTAASSDEAKATVSVASGYSSLTVSAQAWGTATITVTADDGNGGTVEDAFTVTVKAAPVVASAIADVSGLEVGTTQDVFLGRVFSDADGDALTVTAASSDETKATVSVASDGSRLTLTGVAQGTATVTVTAQDTDGNRVSDTFDAPVARKYNALIARMYQWRNDPQWVSDKAHTDRWDRALLAFGETVADATLTAMTAAEAQGYADTDWGERWVPVAKALREIEAAGQQQQGTPNQAPTVSSALADVIIVNESGTRTVSLSGVFSDADSDVLTVTAASSAESVATVSVAPDYSTLTVSARARGTATITVTADDGNGGTVSDTFTVRVKAAPVVASAITDVTGLEEGATQEVSLAGVFSDADGDALTITAASSDETRATVSVASDGSKLTVSGVAEGTATITVTAQDSDGNRVSDAFDVSVVAPPQVTPNQAPTVSAAIGDATIAHESGTRQVSLVGVFDDADGDGLTVTAASSDGAKATVSVATGYSSLTVTAQARGTANITVTADDGNGGTVEDAFTVTVKAAPVVASAIADVSGLVARDTQDVSLSGVFSDADGDALTITAVSSDEAKATVTVAADHSSLTVKGVAEGTVTIAVTAQDSDGNRVSDAFEVAVEPEPEQDPPPDEETPNRPPTVAQPLPDISLEGLQWRQFSLPGVFHDPDGDELTFTSVSSDYGVASTWVSGSTLTVVATGTGTATITVTAEDPDGNRISDAFEVTVRPAS